MLQACIRSAVSRDEMSHEGDETGRGQKNRKLVSMTGSSYDSDCLHMVRKEKKKVYVLYFS